MPFMADFAGETKGSGRAMWKQIARTNCRNYSEHPSVHMHFTPTYSSLLNQVELWFAKIERDVIARGVFTSVTDLKRKFCATSVSTTDGPNL